MCATGRPAPDVYLTGAARLLGEFRRLALALREYRLPASARQVTVVQQHVDASRQQLVTLDPGGEQGTPLDNSGETDVDIDLTSSPQETLAYEPPLAPFAACKPPERAKKKAPRPAKADTRGT